jgi:hypothetical protein
MQVLETSEDKIIKMKFANTTYVFITSMTLMSFIKLIKEGYDRDMHTKILVHVATEKKICDIEKHFGIMIFEYNSISIQLTKHVKYETTVDPRNEMKNAASINPRSSTTTVEMTVSKKIEMLNNQTSKEKEMKKTSQSIINSESVSVSITHEKSDTESHIMNLNQSDETEQNASLNNSHSSRQIDSENDEDHFIKTSNANDDLKERFIKTSNLKNDDLKKQAKSVAKIHHKNSNRIAKA